MNRSRGCSILAIILSSLIGMFLLLRLDTPPNAGQPGDFSESRIGEEPTEAEDSGALVRVSPAALTAGEPVIVEITISAPAEGISVGGRIVFPLYMKIWSGLQRGLTEDQSRNSLVSATRSDGGGLETANLKRHPIWEITSDLAVTVTETFLPGG